MVWLDVGDKGCKYKAYDPVNNEWDEYDLLMECKRSQKCSWKHGDSLFFNITKDMDYIGDDKDIPRGVLCKDSYVEKNRIKESKLDEYEK